MPILPTNIKFDLAPNGDISGSLDLQGGGSWKFTGVDPSFLLNLSKPLLPGMYKFELVDANFEPDRLNAKLYLDTGSGFSEGDKLSLHFQAKKAITYFELGRRVFRVRFDPHDGPGTLSARKIRLTRISTTLHRAKDVARTATARMDSFDEAARLLMKSYNVLRKSGIAGLRSAVRQSVARDSAGLAGAGYADWIRRYDTFSQIDIERLRGKALELPNQPLISVVMPVYNTPEPLLRAAIDSVRSQAYENWQLCIADDASTDPSVRQVLDEYAANDPRIEIRYRSENGHISHASNSALELVKGSWVALLDHDDELRPHALLEVAEAICVSPGAKLIYSDEDKIEKDGRRSDPYFKPDWNYHLFLSHNLVTHLAVFRHDVMQDVGGFRAGFEGAQDYDLTLRIVERCEAGEIVHIPRVLYHWRRVAGSTALASGEKPYAMLAGERALNEHLQRTNVNGKAELISIGYRVHYEVARPAPMVTVIIPTKDRLDLLKVAVASVVEKNDYPHWELLIVDNNSQEPETLSWLLKLEKVDRRIRVLRDEGEFNYSRLNNRAVESAAGDYLLLLNNDVEAINSNWLTEMVSVCTQENVGAVGARLWYPDDTLQHGGVIMGLGGLAGHAHHGLPRGMHGNCGRADLRQEVSAVTAACLLTRRVAFDAVGGLDAKDLTIAYNDIDYCLNLRSRGWKIVWTPYAELYHYESASRGYETTPEKKLRFEREQAVMRERWHDWMVADPAYNPNLSLDNGMFELAFPPRH